uniref:Uncharacterized protein n=1 Tax=Mycena chlorophos TaxID=658473 RepID=A0ABQ0LAE4_MYCCL|nr:predicted protein [Mycena chlorophos]
MQRPRPFLDFNSPGRLFRAFGSLFVLFGVSFYAARRVVKGRRAEELEAWRQAELDAPEHEGTRRSG